MSNQSNTSRRSSEENSVIINNRRYISLGGINEVDSFDENTVVLICSDDIITIDGSDLNITRLSLETGEVTINGLIDGVFYSQTKQPKGGFFSRFK